MARKRTLPEALPRKELVHHSFVQSDTAMSLTDVRVVHSSAKSVAHNIITSSGSSDVAQHLRRYSLVLGRYKHHNTKTALRTWKVSETALDSAERIFANDLYQRVFSEDPSQGTVPTAQWIKSLSEEYPSPEIAKRLLGLVGTDAFTTIINGIAKTNPEFSATLERIGNRLAASTYEFGAFMMMNSTKTGRAYHRDLYRRRAYRSLRQAARYIDSFGNDLADEQKSQRQNTRNKRSRKNGKEQQKGNGRPLTEYDCDGWEPLIVSKPDLTVPHTGKLGRRLIATNKGKYPRYITRGITDPYRRVFSRKTRALGGVVVVDASGSMSLSDDELRLILRSCSGATVIMYSSDHDDHDDYCKRNANCWVIARQGRQVSQIPDVPGGNGVDLPALKYGVSLKRSSISPVVWVSDGQVTGKSGRQTTELLSAVRSYIKQKNIHTVRTAQAAATYLSRIQGGI